MTRGTSYFVSRSAAVRYYKDYEGSIEDSKRAVATKLREGSIHIGKPPLKPGERLTTTDGGKRYMIVEQRIPNGRMVPARIRHKGKTYPGHVKKVNGKVRIFVAPKVAMKINPNGNYSTTQIDTSKDFHTLSSREVEAVLAEADERKYRKPKNASGSRARYFFQKLQREAARSKR